MKLYTWSGDGVRYANVNVVVIIPAGGPTLSIIRLNVGTGT